ncbi:FERM domain-containing protein 4A [Myotis davidii]|uniref:FERM domain-containing protein 4A n=1 Tax=Myotis davidii TaxID=225400 RepID=L5LRU1_MYODS|nr:FERM domain-containing protein 4A [Myotis davidii]
MTEGRRCQVHLLDDRKLELLVQPKLLAKELLDLVASHFNLKEKEYFGIAFTDETGHLNWLQLDRRVLEHDFPKKSGPVVLYFCVSCFSVDPCPHGHLTSTLTEKNSPPDLHPPPAAMLGFPFCSQQRFYIESISYLKDNATIELFFLNAKSCIYKSLGHAMGPRVKSPPTCAPLKIARDPVLASPTLIKPCRVGGVASGPPARHEGARELIDVDSEVVFELASYILQEAKGDFSSNEVVRSDLKKLPALPTQALKEHPSLAYCEDRVIEHYKKLNGQTRGQAIVNYMSIVESLPTYGVHYYAVKDKQGIPWWLGLSYKGIFQYDYHDKVKPRKIFQWRQLENLYFREKKFSVEVHDPRRASVTRRTFGHSGIAVHTWYACPALIKSIWAMAISQHQFYLDRKQSKSKIHAARSLSEIAIDLTETGTLKTSKLANMGSKGKIISGSSGSLLSSGPLSSGSPARGRCSHMLTVPAPLAPAAQITPQEQGEVKKPSGVIRAGTRRWQRLQEAAPTLASGVNGAGTWRQQWRPLEEGMLRQLLQARLAEPYPCSLQARPGLASQARRGSQESDSSQSAKKDMLAALKSRQEALEETLRQRLEELKKLCLREAELTGKLPVEYPLDPGEEPPIVRRRIGTAFKLDEQKILPKGEEAELERLEREFAIQSQITEAARRLASDPNVSKKLKKQRKTSYLNALKKLQEIENAINENRIKSGKKPTQRASLIIDDGNIGSEDSSLSDALVLEDEDSQVSSTLSPLQSPHKGLPPRPPSSHNRPPPPQSLEGLRQMHYHRNDYDKSPLKPKMWSESSLDEPYEKVKKRSSHSHSSSHKRFPSTGSCAEAGGGSNSLQNSPIRSLPHWNSQSSMPSTPDLRVRSPHYVHSTRSVDLSPTRLHSLALHFRHRSSSLESQGKLLGSENDTGSPDFYTPRTRSSNGSDPMDDCSSCTSHSSSEHYYPAQMNANYSTLAEDSPSKARARQRQRQRAAGSLGTANSGSMPNLAARGGGGNAPGVYLHSQSQPSSQYRIKEYPLYIEGGATPVVVRSLESDQEGHYSVKAQFKTSNSYTAGGLFRESWRASEEGDAGRLTPSRSQILGTPSLGRECSHDKGTGRTAVSDELRQWYQRSTASHKEHSRLSHTSSTSSDSGSQYSTSSQSTFLAHSRVTRMPQMCKATSAALPQSQRSSTPSSEIGATPPSSPHHILTWQTGSYSDSCFLDSPLYPELADVQWYGQEKAKPGTLV